MVDEVSVAGGCGGIEPPLVAVRAQCEERDSEGCVVVDVTVRSLLRSGAKEAFAAGAEHELAKAV